MPTSADARRACRGFTLLEVLVTLGIVALAIVPLLGVRDAIWNIAYRSGHMLRAAAYAEQILAERMTNPEDVKQYQAAIEEDPAFHYELTIESYDLATGRVDEPGDESTSTTSNFSAESSLLPPDAQAAPEEDLYDDPLHVRRFTLKVSYPGLDDDQEEEYLLEGYLPMARKELENGVPAAK
jgi:prepilin-type N-terminal cleavage/methylation domain-containing protein